MASPRPSHHPRSRSRSPEPPWRRKQHELRRDYWQKDNNSHDGPPRRRGPATFAQEQTRRNQEQEDAQMRMWVSQEDDFVLKQSKKKARIRVKEGRAKPIDWLAVALSILDPNPDFLDDDEDGEIDAMDPEAVLEELGEKDLREVTKDVDHYLVLESSIDNRIYWNALKVICEHRRRRLAPAAGHSTRASAVSADVDNLLRPKTLEQLATLEHQVNAKLSSGEPIDEEYWEGLLENIGVYKAKAQVRSVYQSILDSRLQALKKQQIGGSEELQRQMENGHGDASSRAPRAIPYSQNLDPEPQLRISAEDKALKVVDESGFLAKIAEEREKVTRLGFVPARQRKLAKQTLSTIHKPQDLPTLSDSRLASTAGDGFSQATQALYDREVARGVQEDEEIFTGEEDVSTLMKSTWTGKYRPRKPRYFNRVQMGYEWNKYNQTHYDHDNPPPKVVQGYKFNIFYPELIDKNKAPTYRIERENGRKKGQSFAPAGEEDTCLIRFISGPPYEDLAFRIVDKEWDYSAKRERGFKSSFDKGILQLHFQFKKVYYRK